MSTPLRSSPTPSRAWLLGGGVSILVLSWSGLFLPRFQDAISVAAVVFLAASGWILWRSHASGAWRIAMAVAVVAALGYGGFAILGWYPAWVIGQIGAMTFAFAGFARVAQLRRIRKKDARSHYYAVFSFGRSLLVSVAVLASAAIGVMSVSAAPVVSILASAAGVTNSFEPEGESGRKSTLTGSAELTSDVPYANEFPRSFLDVYTAGGDDSSSRPTYVYVHGGGWVGGDKVLGDPNATDPSASSYDVIYEPALAAGYNVVAMNYAFAPAYPYPTQLVQMGQAITFLQNHAEEYGISMDRVVVGGGSAGGQLSGEFANIQTDPAYARQVGIEPVMSGNLKAVALDSPALDMTRLKRTQAPVIGNDFLYNSIARAYLGDNAGTYAEANVIEHVSQNFPPTFISDGNTGTFPDQAQDLIERMNALGVQNAAYLPPVEEAILGHGFMVRPSSFTDIYNAKKFAFLDSVVK